MASTTTSKDTSQVQIIGRVLPNPRGVWDLNTEYSRLDFVTYEGSGYIATTSSTGKYPSVYESSWTLVCQKGEKGDKGDKGVEGTGSPIFRGSYDSSETYGKNDIVEVNGSSWTCMFDDTVGVYPEDGVTVTVDEVEYPVWRLACKGVAYKIDSNGEVAFYNDSTVVGIKTYTDNVYIKTTDSKKGITTESTLQSKIDELETKINYVGRILEKYNLD